MSWQLTDVRPIAWLTFEKTARSFYVRYEASHRFGAKVSTTWSPNNPLQWRLGNLTTWRLDDLTTWNLGPWHQLLPSHPPPFPTNILPAPSRIFMALNLPGAICIVSPTPALNHIHEAASFGIDPREAQKSRPSILALRSSIKTSEAGLVWKRRSECRNALLECGTTLSCRTAVIKLQEWVGTALLWFNIRAGITQDVRWPLESCFTWKPLSSISIEGFNRGPYWRILYLWMTWSGG